MKRILASFALLITVFLNALEPSDSTPCFDVISHRMVNKKQHVQDTSYQYTLSICTIFKDVAPYLKEWIEYHLLVGVEHFYLYNNSSEDDYLTVLQPYIDSDIVTLVDWPDRDTENWGDTKYAWVATTQKSAILDAIEVSKPVTKWLAVIDADEFLVPVKDNNLIDLLKKYERFPGIKIRWQTYGTSGIDDIPPNKLLIELLTYKAPTTASINSMIKEIIRPALVKNIVWIPHTFSFIDNEEARKTKINEVRINHYIHRTINYFYTHKVKNKEKIDNVQLTQKFIDTKVNAYNEVEDRIMDRFIPELRHRMGFLP
jgi:hypothetical protein